MWAGFDQHGSSLGTNQTGATATGWIWGEYMAYINSKLPVKDFTKPSTGLVEMEVCAVSGQIPTDNCSEGTVKEIFLAGTEPKSYCKIHSFEKSQEDTFSQKFFDDFSTQMYAVQGVDLLEDPYKSGESKNYEEIDSGMMNFLLDDPFINTTNSNENTDLLD